MLLSKHVLILSSLAPSFAIDYQPKNCIDTNMLIFVLVGKDEGCIHHSDYVFKLIISSTVLLYTFSK